jgi:hypothetical protein
MSECGVVLTWCRCSYSSPSIQLVPSSAIAKSKRDKRGIAYVRVHEQLGMDLACGKFEGVCSGPGNAITANMIGHE